MEKKLSAKEIEQILKQTPEEALPEAMSCYREDSRDAVQKLLIRYEKKHTKYLEELARLEQILSYERQAYEKGYTYVCGIDEAGRGPLAGPVVAAAVILPPNKKIMYLNDSKQVSAKLREQLYDTIMEEAIGVGVGIVSPARIDEINILQATYEAMRYAVAELAQQPEVLLVDAVKIPELDLLQVPIVKGDAKSMSIAAASIIAKVTRDRMMVMYDELYPQYGFAEHKGYGSRKHYDALHAYGVSPIHRRSFLKSMDTQWQS